MERLDDPDQEERTFSHRLQEREIAIKEAEQKLKEQEIALRRDESRRARWSNPLVVAIGAAAVAAFSNAIVSYINGWQQQELESTRSEAARILEMIKTGDTGKAIENLRFLEAAGLIDDPNRRTAIQAYLDKLKPGAGPSLPSPTPSYASTSAIWGIVYGADQTEEAAKDELKTVEGIGLTPLIYHKQNLFLSVVPFASNGEAQARLGQIRNLKQYYRNAYIVNLDVWCSNPTLTPSSSPSPSSPSLPDSSRIINCGQ